MFKQQFDKPAMNATLFWNRNLFWERDITSWQSKAPIWD